jgi:hypothetical protein
MLPNGLYSVAAFWSVLSQMVVPAPITASVAEEASIPMK